SVLQWIGVVVAPLAWTLQHVVGYGVGEARCSVAGVNWGIGYDVWQLAIMACAGVLILISEAAAVTVSWRRARRTTATGRRATGAGAARSRTAGSTSSQPPRWWQTPSSSR